MKEIKIENTKGIKNLTFTFPEQNGVYLLVGANGVGKTTLMVCMERICNPLAFARGFSTSKSWSEIDQFENAAIQYTTDKTCVIFRKKTAKWVPTPKKNSASLLQEFGFSDVVFIRADAKRIDISQADLRAGNFVAVDQEIKQSLNLLMETDKYSQLRRLKNVNGRGRQATYFYVIQDSNKKWYSEKRFSTGELALLRLVEQLRNVPEHTLVLVDEAEMALHPRVQANLIKYLREQASAKNITIFVSTHSPSMIKAVDKENIINLCEQENGVIHAVTPCYPAAAIGSVDFESSTIFDYIFFVEDDIARTILKELLNRYVILNPSHKTALVSIIPVGGFYQTAELAVRTRRQVFSQSKIFAVLDQDAFEIPDKNKKSKSKELFENNKNIIRSLTFTPEVWLVDQLSSAHYDLRDHVRNKFHAELSSIFQNREYLTLQADNVRFLAKKQWDFIIKSLCDSSGDNDILVESQLIFIIVNHLPDSDIKRILGPLLGK